MTVLNDRWTNIAGGNFDTDDDWSAGTPSGIDDYAILGQIDGSTQHYTVTIDASDNNLGQLPQLSVSSYATLLFEPGSYDTWDRFNVANSGTIELMGVASGNWPSIEWGSGVNSGTFTNVGVVDLDGGAVEDNSSLEFAGPTVNSGLFEMTGKGGFIFFGNSKLTNSGRILAEGVGDPDSETGGVNLSMEAVNNQGGILGTTSTTSGASFDIGAGVIVIGGTLQGLVQFDGSPGDSLLDNVTLATGALLRIDDTFGGASEVEGAIVNHGLIDINCPNESGAALTILDQVTLTGGGVVELAWGSYAGPGVNDIFGAASAVGRLDNVNNLIEGEGQIAAGPGRLVLKNEAGGTIEAHSNAVTSGSLFNGQQYNLVIDTNEIIVNAGKIETSAEASMLIDDEIDNGGKIDALYQPLAIDGALIGAGAEYVFDTTLTLNNAVNSSQTVNLLPSATLELGAPSVFHGWIAGFSRGDAIELDGFNGATLEPLTYSGTSTRGTLSVFDGVHRAELDFVGDYAAASFTPTGTATGVTLTKTA